MAGLCPRCAIGKRFKSSCLSGTNVKGQKILDVGTRETRVIPLIFFKAGRYHDVFGPGHVADHRRCNIEVIKADVQGLPFPDNSFDAVTCIATVKMIAKWGDKRAVEEMMRVVK